MEANQRRRSPLPKQSGPHSPLPHNGHPRGLAPGRDPVPRQAPAPAPPVLEGLGSLTQVGRRQEPFEKGVVAGERRGPHRDHCGIAGWRRDAETVVGNRDTAAWGSEQGELAGA